MGILRRSGRVTASDERRARALGRADLVDSPEVLAATARALPLEDPTERWPVSRADALSVPVVNAALGIIAGRGSTLPLRRWGSRGEPLPPGSFIRQPEPDVNRPLQWTLLHTIRDMALFEHAYWRVLVRDGRGFPLAAAYARWEDVSERTQTVPGTGQVLLGYHVAGEPVELADIIRFTGPVQGGWTRAGARILRTAMALERAARLYAEEPLPQIILRNTSGVDLPAEKVTGILDAWRRGRQSRSASYLNSAIEAQPLGWNAHDMQLVEGRQQTVMEVSRLTGIPSGLLGAAASGTSLTYRNLEGENHQMYESMLAYLGGIETRLSQEDVTPRGQAVRFDLTAILRPDTTTVVQMIRDLVPIDVMGLEEARAMLGLPVAAGEHSGGGDPFLLPTPGSAPAG